MVFRIRDNEFSGILVISDVLGERAKYGSSKIIQGSLFRDSILAISLFKSAVVTSESTRCYYCRYWDGP